MLRLISGAGWACSVAAPVTAITTDNAKPVARSDACENFMGMIFMAVSGRRF
jgi:hypothetical protein